MKKSMILLAGPAYLLVLAGLTCTRFTEKTKEEHAYFWKRTDSAGTYFLYIDDDLKGVLPFNTAPVASTHTQNVVPGGLAVALTNGEHQVQARDKSGDVFGSGIVLVTQHQGGEAPAISWSPGDGAIEIACTK